MSWEGERVGIDRRWERERVGIDRRRSGVGEGESGRVGWEGGVGIDRRSGVGEGESGDRQAWCGRGRDWGAGRGRERG